MKDIVTVKSDHRTGRQGKMYKISFDRLPDREFGPYQFGRAKDELVFCCDMTPVEARALVMEASLRGAAREEYGDTDD